MSQDTVSPQRMKFPFKVNIQQFKQYIPNLKKSYKLNRDALCINNEFNGKTQHFEDCLYANFIYI